MGCFLYLVCYTCCTPLSLYPSFLLLINKSHPSPSLLKSLLRPWPVEDVVRSSIRTASLLTVICLYVKSVQWSKLDNCSVIYNCCFNRFPCLFIAINSGLLFSVFLCSCLLFTANWFALSKPDGLCDGGGVSCFSLVIPMLTGLRHRINVSLTGHGSQWGSGGSAIVHTKANQLKLIWFFWSDYYLLKNKWKTEDLALVWIIRIGLIISYCLI